MFDIDAIHDTECVQRSSLPNREKPVPGIHVATGISHIHQMFTRIKEDEESQWNNKKDREKKTGV